MKNKKYIFGTTLVEIIVYFALLSVLLLAAISFALNVLTTSKSSDNFHELQTNMDFVVSSIVSAVESADGINGASIFDSDNGRLALNVANAQNSPTQFYLSNGAVMMQQGAATPVQLNSNSAPYTKFRFHRISSAKTPDHLVLDFEATLSADIARLDKTVSAHLSLSLRK